MRTEFSDTYYVREGLYRVVTGNVINWKYDYNDPNEQWKPANPQWSGNTIINAPYTMTVSGSTVTVTSRKTGGTVTMTLDAVGGNKVDLFLGSSTVASGVEGVDIKITPYADRVSFARVITDKLATTQAVYLVSQTGSGLYISPDAKDADGKPLPVQYNLKDGRITEWIDEKDLADAKYPLTIDPTISPYSSTSDGYLGNTDVVYLTAHDAGVASTVTNTTTYANIGQAHVIAGNLYSISRAYFYFDTSVISPADTIVSASVYLYGVAGWAFDDYNYDVVVQSGQPTYPSDPMVAADYNMTYYSGDGGSINILDWAEGVYNEIALNSDGINMINKGGTTKLCMRSSRDISSSSGVVNTYEYVRVDTSEQAGVAADPYLTIDYEPTVRTATGTALAQTSTHDLVITKPVGTVEGDALIAAIGYYLRGNPITVTAPSGWTQLATYSANPYGYLYYKIAGASEPATYTWTMTQTAGGATNYIYGMMESVIGGTFSIDDPIDDFSNVNYVVNDVNVRASMTTNYDNEVLVFFGFASNVGVTFSPPTVPSTFDEDIDYNDGWISATADHGYWTSHGATGNIDAVMSGATPNKHGFAVALNPPIPTIQTISTSYVTNYTARLNGYVSSDDNGSDVSTRFQWWTGPDVWNGYNTTWDSPYHTGGSFYEDISGLSELTNYYYMAQGAVGNIISNGTILMFTTTASPQPPTDARIYTEDDRIVLAWTRGYGTSATMVRWKLGDYPSSTGDGTLLIQTEYSTATHEGLDYGTEYFYTLWGWTGTNYTTPIYARITTGAGATTTGYTPTTTPALWFTTVDYTRYASMPMYVFINAFVGILSSDLNFGWTALGLFVCVALGALTLFATKKGKTAVIVMGGVMLILVLLRLLPGYLAAFAVLFFIGASKMSNPNEGVNSQ